MNYVEFEWGSSETFEPSLPLREWNHGVEQEGGHATSSAGLPAAFVIRTQETIELVLRVLESEWSACLGFLRAGMAGAEITVEVAENDPVNVFFVSPVMGDSFTTDRDPDFPRVLNVAITIRASDGGDLNLLFYEAES